MAESEGPDHVRFTVAIDWVRGQDPDIVVRRAGPPSQNNRAAIAYVLRMAARLVEEADDSWIEKLN